MFPNRTFISDYYHTVTEIIRKEVAAQSDSYLLSVKIDEYAAYLFKKYSLPEVVFDNSRDRSIEKIRKSIEVDDFGRRITRELLWVRIKLPVVENDKISQVLELMPSAFTHSPPKMEYRHGFIVTEVPAKGLYVERAIEDITQEVNRRNADIKKYNGELRSKIHNIIDSRRTKIENEDALLEQIAKKVSVPLKQKVKSSSLLPPSLKVKEKIRPIMPPKATPPIELQLERDKFDGILELIDNCCRMFERTPATFSKMEEEELRDVILSNLNGVFEGNAVGEAFSKLGKTDIYLKVAKGGVFIAECKYWKGPKTVEETVAQILDYLTWRHSYGVVILFSRNKGFSPVIQSLSEMIVKVPSYVKGFKKLEDTHFKAQHHLPEDDKKLVEIHFMVYNLYAERAN